MYVDNIAMLFDKYENIDIKTMGFPENVKYCWKYKIEDFLWINYVVLLYINIRVTTNEKFIRSFQVSEWIIDEQYAIARKEPLMQYSNIDIKQTGIY